MKHLTILLTIFFFSCGKRVTSFYVINNSENEISFNSSVAIQNSKPLLNLNHSYIVSPNDSVLAYQTKIEKSKKNKLFWLKRFAVLSTDSLKFNDAKQTVNWTQKSANVYVLKLIK